MELGEGVVGVEPVEGLGHRDERHARVVEARGGGLIINPEKEIALLAILTIPLCVSASWMMAEIFQIPNENRKAVVIKAAFVVVLCGFIWLNAVWIIKNGWNAAPDFTVRLLAIIGGIVMIILVTLLIGWGWSWQIAKTVLDMGAINGFINI